jgi:hypothetical protein
VILAALALSGPVTGQNAGTANVPTATFEPERVWNTGVIVYGSATMLVRTREDVTATIHTSGLTPGNVYTAWMGIFNDPRFCSTRPCSSVDLMNPQVQGSLLGMGGKLVGADGVASFGEVRAVGDTTNARPGFAGPGLQDTRRAEIHLVVRDHGSASLDPATFLAQLTTFNGGCPPNACGNVQAVVHRP